MGSMSHESMGLAWPYYPSLWLYVSFIESKLLYGLACCCMTVTEQRRLDGFQAYCLRQVLRIKPAYYSRISNKTVLERAKHKPASELLLQQQLKLLGNILTVPQSSQMHSVTFVPGTLKPATSLYIRRAGRPHKEWAPTVLQGARQRNTTSADLHHLAINPDQWMKVMRESG